MPDLVVYVSNAASNDIVALAMDRATGALDPIERISLPGTTASPTSLPLAISPDRRSLYAAHRSPPYLATSFSIDHASGRLTPRSTTPLAAAMAYLTTDRTGRVLLGASYTDAKIACYALDLSGSIQGARHIITTGRNAHCIVIDPANRYAYGAILGADHLMQLVFDPAAGTLSPNTPPTIATRPHAGPRHLTFHPNGRFIYGLNETDATVNTYRIDPTTGTLTEIATISTLPAPSSGPASAADLHATPDGRFLYASERHTSTLTGLRIDPDTARLTPIGRWATETTPRGFAIDPTSRFLLAAGLDSDALSVHAIDPQTGSLTLHARHRMGTMPNWVEIVDLS